MATWNVEWFNALFDDRGRMLADDQPSGRYGVTRGEQLGALGIVFSALDADAVMVIEAPDTSARRRTATALEGFSRHFGLRASACLHGFTSETEQEIALLYDPTRLTVRHDPRGHVNGRGGRHVAPTPRFDGAFHYDLDTDVAPEVIRFSKPPLEVQARGPDGRSFRMIGVHAKSKAPHGADDPAHVMRLAIENRRKQLAQCIWIRARVEEHLAHGDSLMVLGDFNDGPGLDEFERLFGRSGVEIVLGAGAEPGRRMFDPHAAMALQSKVSMQPTSARFWHGPRKRWFEALLDFIMISPDLAARSPDWRIWHPFNDPGIASVPELREALLQASDHFPVTLDLPLVQAAPAPRAQS